MDIVTRHIDKYLDTNPTIPCAPKKTVWGYIMPKWIAKILEIVILDLEQSRRENELLRDMLDSEINHKKRLVKDLEYALSARRNKVISKNPCAKIPKPRCDTSVAKTMQ